MALPGQGNPLSMSQIGQELGLGQLNLSLRNLSSQVGFQQPDSISEFYGYSNDGGGGDPPPPRWPPKWVTPIDGLEDVIIFNPCDPNRYAIYDGGKGDLGFFATIGDEGSFSTFREGDGIFTPAEKGTLQVWVYESGRFAPRDLIENPC